MMNRYISRLLLFVGWATLAASQGPVGPSATSLQGYLSTDEAKQYKIVHTNIQTIQRGLSVFRDIELREPASYKELCDSYYIPVRCTDILNPYANRPLEDHADSPGDTHWETSVAGLETTYYWV
ncbi:MAG: hypothetical protein ACREJQ_00385 [bacterium]